MYNYYPQQQPVVQRPQILKGHPVSSLEEVRATSIDFDGSVSYFPDLANKKIYTKSINVTDGTAQLNMYELKPIPADPSTMDYVTRQEFEAAMSKIATLLEEQQKSQPSFKEVF